MTSRIFFYGLYMDATLLEEMSLRPKTVGVSKLDGYKIQIGERATLVPAPGHTSYGVLLDLPAKEASAIYSRPEVDDYRPDTVEAVLLSDDSQHQALCYVLPKEKLGADTNTEYVYKLATLAGELGLPPEYVQDISHCGDDT